MKEGQTDFLDEMVREEEAAASPSEPTQPEQSGVPRDDKGRFAPKGEQTETDQVETGGKSSDDDEQGEAPPAPHEENEFVPKSVVIALRKELQALKAGKNGTASQQSGTQQPQPTLKGPEFAPPQIDYDEDPQSYLQAHVHSLRMEQSKFFAIQQSSEAELSEAWAAFDQACNTDPAVSAYSETLIKHPHPMGEVLKWHKRQKQLAMLEEAGGLDALRERWIAEELAKRTGQPAPQPAAGTAPQRQTQPKPATLPSLANGGGGQANAPELLDEDEDFNGFFEGARKPRKR